jgi:hypothetical protein
MPTTGQKSRGGVNHAGKAIQPIGLKWSFSFMQEP